MRRALGSKLRRDTDYLQDVHGLPQFLQANAEIVHKLSYGHYIPFFLNTTLQQFYSANPTQTAILCLGQASSCAKDTHSELPVRLVLL
jgi:hypothetical protein